MDDLVTLVVEPAAAVSGAQVRIVLAVDVPDGVHIEPHLPAEPFLIPTVVTVNGLTDVTVSYPEPVKKDLGWNDVALTVLEGPLEFVVTGIRTEETTVSGGLSYQPCLGGACLPPRTSVWSIEVGAAVVGA